MDTRTRWESAMLRRQERLLGNEVMDNISDKRVIIFGVGGVGGWCAESLVRSGIRHLTIVDSDKVCITNCNRQLAATYSTVGKVKVEVLRQRLLDINPDADITAIENLYTKETAESYHLEQYDYVIDAIDSLEHKARLMIHATKVSKSIDSGDISGVHANKLKFFSSMGAALRTDPFAIREDEFWNVEGDSLARALRKKFKYWGEYPQKKFRCVYSRELPLQNIGEDLTCGMDCCICQNEQYESSSIRNTPDTQEMHNWTKKKAQVNGTVSHVTAMFGFALAGMVINDITKEAQAKA